MHSQTIDEIKFKIDNLESIKNDLEKKIKIIDKYLEELRTKRNDIEFSNIQDKISAVVKYDVRLRSQPVGEGEYIEIIPSGKTVNIIGADGSFLEIEYSGKKGYIFDTYLVHNEDIDKFIEKMKKQTEDRRIHEEDLKQENRKKELIKKYGKSIANNILEGKIWIGMNKTMATESIGSPDKINRQVNNNTIIEQWIYDHRELYLYFNNGLLRSWQDSK